MAKKNVVYTPINKTAYSIPQIIEQKIPSIPAYEDAGVKFQGKYKIARSNSEYELRNQQRAIYNAKITDVTVVVPWTINRTPNTKFYCVYVIVETNSPMAYLDIYDGQYNTNNAKIYLKMPVVVGTRYDKNIDFSSVPLQFNDAIQIYQVGLWAVGDYLTITFYGWEEQI